MEIDISGVEDIMWIQWEDTEGAIKSIFAINYKKDIAQDTLNFKEYTDPFTGEPVK